MKTIVLKSNNTSIYTADDSITIDTSGDRIKWLADNRRYCYL